MTLNETLSVKELRSAYGDITTAMFVCYVQVTSVSGRVGDRLFSVKKTTRGQTGKAIVTAKVDKANYRQPKQPDTITYLGNEEVKSNVWWLAD